MRGLNVVDISEYRAERLDQLCLLLASAACLLTIDTAILHLSYAVGCPTVALLSDTRGIASATHPRRHWRKHFTYSRAVREPQAVAEAVAKVVEGASAAA